MADSANVIDKPEQSRFELAVGEQVAIAAYERRGKVLLMTHTEVPETLEGRGIASTLIRGALANVRARNERIVPLCRFVAAYIEKHPEAADLVAER